LAAVDTAIADRITAWRPLSEYKLTQALDVWVDAIDPGAVRRPRESARSRDFTIGDDQSGTTPVWGRLFGTDAALLGQRLDAMACMVCGDDPRTLPQRRADALGALAAGPTERRANAGSPTVLQSSTTAASAASSSTSSPIGNRRRPLPMPNSMGRAPSPRRVRRRGDERRPH
jgi:hypothetical protein